MIVEVFDDDRMNDHQMAVDLFDAISIPDSNKDFLTLYSDSLEGYVMSANHYVPYGVYEPNGEENFLDFHGIFKILDALEDCSWFASAAGRKVALGHGTPEQRYMGEWGNGRLLRPLEVTDSPRAVHPQLQYTWAWDNKVNPRRKKADGGE